jgi:hypothetical protein
MTKIVQMYNKNCPILGKKRRKRSQVPRQTAQRDPDIGIYASLRQAGVLPRLNFPKGTLFNRVNRSGLGFMERWLEIAVEWNNLEGLVKSPTSTLRCIS